MEHYFYLFVFIGTALSLYHCTKRFVIFVIFFCLEFSNRYQPFEYLYKMFALDLLSWFLASLLACLLAGLLFSFFYSNRRVCLSEHNWGTRCALFRFLWMKLNIAARSHIPMHPMVPLFGRQFHRYMCPCSSGTRLRVEIEKKPALWRGNRNAHRRHISLAYIYRCVYGIAGRFWGPMSIQS